MHNPVLPIVEWYLREGRALPWRQTKDPYRIWLSEVILQQTRIDQGTAYFYRFLEEFPTVQDLAAAPSDRVMKCWEGLGYYSRARNLHATAKIVSEQMNGQFPGHFNDLEKLKGVGPYTARAIGSIAFGNLVGVVDGNVQRVLSRYLGDEEPVDLPASRKRMQQTLDGWLLAASHVRSYAGLSSDFNQGMMDLGAMVCKPTQPVCNSCPLIVGCEAYRLGMQDSLPRKAGKLKRKVVFVHFYLLQDEKGQVFIRRRPEKGIWGGLWELPNREVQETEWETEEDHGLAFLGGFKHVFTHLDMMIHVFSGQAATDVPTADGIWVSKEEMASYGFSKAVLKIFNQFLS